MQGTMPPATPALEDLKSSMYFQQDIVYDWHAEAPNT